jgi:hypothetical protein
MIWEDDMTKKPTIDEMIKALRDMTNNCKQLADTVNYFSPGKVRAEDFTEPADIVLKAYRNNM